MPYTDQAIQTAPTGMHSPDAADRATSAGAVSVLPSLDAVSESADVDHLAIEAERGANCARIRELMAEQRAGN
jgi:hypothetical protein